MEFLNLSSVLALIVTFQSLSFAIKLDPNVGSNWYPTVPTTTIPARSSPSLLQSSGNNAPSSHYNNAKFQSSSSFLQTAPVSWGGVRPNSNPENYYKYYYHVQQPSSSTSESPQNQYQYYHQQPETNEYSGITGPEQRQEFLDPSILTNGLPFGNGIDGEVDDGSQGSIFDILPSLPTLPSLGTITSGLLDSLQDTASAVGLGGLGIFGALIVAAIGAPLLVLFILFPVAILVVSILGFPVLQLTLPPSDPFLGRKLKSSLVETARKAREVLQSEECVERLSCVLAKKSRKLPYENWILEKMDTISHPLVNRVSKSVQTGRAGEDCQKFSCKPVTKLRTFYESVISVPHHKLT